MVDEQIARNLRNATITEWLLQQFTTTTSTDRIAASVTIMSTLQSFFEYRSTLSCGIPNITLEGTPDDWRLLRRKVDRLPFYDIKRKKPVMAMWHTLLSPVLVDEFVQSSEGKASSEFWDTVGSRTGGGSGPSYLSGWVTVFCSFSAKGKWQGDVPPEEPAGPFRQRNAVKDKVPPKWPYVDTSDVPVGVVSVPMLVNDNGIEYDTQMLAGQFAYQLDFPQISPRTDWCIAYNGKPRSNMKGRLILLSVSSHGHEKHSPLLKHEMIFTLYFTLFSYIG